MQNAIILYTLLSSKCVGRRWRVNPNIVVTTRIKSTTHIYVTINFNLQYKVLKYTIYLVMENIRNNALKYSMNILLHNKIQKTNHKYINFSSTTFIFNFFGLIYHGQDIIF